MTPEEKQHLDNLFPKELPKEYTAAEKLKDAQFKIAQLEKMLSEAKLKDNTRKALWRNVFEWTIQSNFTEDASGIANHALEHYDKTFYGH